MRLLAILAVALAFPAASSATSNGIPNPCKLVTAQTASAYLHAPAKGYPEVSNSGARHCLYIASSGRLDVEFGRSAEYVKATPAPGVVVTEIPSLGENGGTVYVRRSHFALAAFELGAYYYTVDSSQLPVSKVLALSRHVLAQLH